MYTRNYYPEEKISVPENYDGNAFREDIEPATEEKETAAPPPDAEPTGSWSPPWENTPKPTEEPSEPTMGRDGDGGGFLSGLFKKGSLSSLLGNFGIFKNGLFDIGTEEILIIGVALFLFFSSGGDKECAIMLLLLLFIK